MEYAFEFIKNRGGVTTETYYPYKADDGNCDTLKVYLRMLDVAISQVNFVICPQINHNKMTTKTDNFVGKLTSSVD